jgi:hypothetical protein
MEKLSLAAFTAAALLAGCAGPTDDGAHTLYRSSPVEPDGKDWRLHVATFDAVDGDSYNAGNCRIAADLFAAQPGITVRYWCEKGRFRK